MITNKTTRFKAVVFLRMLPLNTTTNNLKDELKEDGKVG